MLLVSACDLEHQSSHRSPPAMDPSETALTAANEYRMVDNARAGMVSGVVRWSGAVPDAVRVPVRTHLEACGQERAVETIHVSPRGGVEGAVVVLIGIETELLPPLGDLNFTFQDCDLSPRIAVTTPGANLHVRNSDSILHNLHIRIAREERDGARETRLDVGLPALRGSVDLGAEVGIHTIVDDAAHPWIETYVYVAAHPYVVLTDAEGHFEMTRVPVGAYQIRVWHPGTAESGDTSSGRPQRSAPMVLTRSIRVEEANDTKTDFQLAASQ